MSEQVIWTMDSDYCDNCGAYLFEDGINDDNSGLCSTCFDLWLAEQNDFDEDYEDYEDEDWHDVGRNKETRALVAKHVQEVSDLEEKL